jgi:hypothetical protein
MGELYLIVRLWNYPQCGGTRPILFHMVGYTRVSKRVNFQPSISTNSELHLEDVTFK